VPIYLAPIPVRSPFPWSELLQYLSLRLIPDIERVAEGSYFRRTAEGNVTVSFDERLSELTISTDQSHADAPEIRARAATLFDVDCDSRAIARELARSAVLAPRIAKVPGMRPLGTWSAFELCVRTILGQQVTVAAAGTLMRRWVQRCGSITPDCILAADLSAIGMPSRRVDTIRELARAVLDRRVSFEGPWSEIDRSLQALPGFGPWTREYLAIRLGREADAFPSSDLGLIRAASVDSPKALLKLAESWRPYRAYAAIYLWAVAPGDGQ
jgi:DNA-3-methyladenine glycosylase II